MVMSTRKGRTRFERPKTNATDPSVDHACHALGPEGYPAFLGDALGYIITARCTYADVEMFRSKVVGLEYQSIE